MKYTIQLLNTQSGNILVQYTEYRAVDIVALADFGVSTIMLGDNRRAQTLAGTESHMVFEHSPLWSKYHQAPEIKKNKSYDPFQADSKLFHSAIV